MPAQRAAAALGHEDVATLLAPWGGAFPGLALAVDGQARIVYASAAAAGRSPSELVGQPLLALVRADHRALVEAAVKDAISPGLAHTFEVPLVPATGPAATWWTMSFSRLAARTGPPLVLLVGHETTARHAEEARLRHAEGMMVDTEGITHLGTWYWDVTQPNAQWSAELYRIYGLDPARHVPTYQDYLTRVHPDDVERVKAATDAVFNDSKPYSHDERIRHSDGTWRRLHTWARPIKDRDGKLLALAGVCQDITDRKRAEEAHLAAEARFRSLFERSEAGLAILDTDGVVLEANQMLTTMAAGANRGPAVGRRLRELAEPENRAAVDQAVRKAAAGEPARCEALLRRLGGPHPVRIDLAQVVPGGDARPFILAVALERGQDQAAADTEALARIREIRELEEKGIRRNRLLRVASHELKNPLTPVVFQLHMLQTRMLGPLNDRQGHAVDVASRQVGRISHLLRDVLDVARIEEGHLAVRCVPLEVGELARRAVDAYADPAADWNVALEAQPAVAGAECWVDADPDRLEQAMANLVSNALKFTPRGGRVAVRWGEADGLVAITVTDTGPGFSPQQAERLFQAFSQVHAPGQSREEGTGLGLYITRHLVERMGGRVEASGEPGRGASFRITLPARRAGVAVDGTHAA